MTLKERDPLIDNLIEGSISEADFFKLEAEMRVSSEARQAYYSRLKLTDSLRLESSLLLEEESDKTVSIWPGKFSVLAGIAAVFSVAFISIYGLKSSLEDRTNDIAAAEPIATGYAVLAEQSEAVWVNEPNLDRGDLVPQGPLQMDSGLARLELFSGVTIILEGKAEFEINSPMEMSVLHGKIRALVPTAAHGFRVLTNSGDVVDLGTEFALNVTPEHADMHVLDGEIEWHPNAKQKQHLSNGQSLRWTATGNPESVVFEPSQFPGLADFERRFVSQRLQRRQAWSDSAAVLANDPRMIAYYPMHQSNKWGRQLLDSSHSGLNGTVVSARHDADRWGQSGSALNFSPAGSRVRVSIPGEHRSVTFYCWARIDSLDRMYNSLFLTDGHELNEPHWQIMNDGRLFFSVKRRDAVPRSGKDKHIAYSPPMWDPSQSGKWLQIATVYNVDEQTTTHFVNGEAISQDRISDEYIVDTVRIGAASIGNWNEPTRGDPNFALRNLNGAIDEFAIFSGSLSASEIAELYEKGRP